ncbi:MAG: hypothetical protein JNL98_04420 [Bryobacterales bacterium]|nr:hypothetical protein [Bryobacterales bacterium]
MQLSDVFLGLGEQTFQDLLRTVSMGKLKTYHLYERLKVRAHFAKLNSETLRKAGPRLWARMGERNDDYATDLAQAVLVSHLDMIQAVLNDLGVPHDEGFFAKDTDVSQYLSEGWQPRLFEKFQGSYPKAALLFYLNHLAWEVGKGQEIFRPAA